MINDIFENKLRFRSYKEDLEIIHNNSIRVVDGLNEYGSNGEKYGIIPDYVWYELLTMLDEYKVVNNIYTLKDIPIITSIDRRGYSVNNLIEKINTLSNQKSDYYIFAGYYSLSNCSGFNFDAYRFYITKID